MGESQAASGNAVGFWLVVGRAVDNEGFLSGIKKRNEESNENWRRRLEGLRVDNARLNRDDIDALTRQWNGMTIIDLIAQCKSGWASPQASYRT